MSSKNLLSILAVGLMVWFAGCATAPVTPGPSNNLKVICEQYNVQWYVDSVSHVVNLRAAGREANAMIGSSVVVVDGQKVFLSDVLRREQGAVIVPPDFVSKVVMRMSADAMAGRPGFHIVVDAGHGGKDPGAIGRTGTQEKDIALDISRRLRNNLQSRGFKVTMTRDRDEFISLEERTAIATRAKADLFVSVHANSSPSRTVDGLEVYTLRDLEAIEKRDPQRLQNHRTLYKNLAMQDAEVNVQAIVADMLYNYKMTESQLLASHVNKATSLTAQVASRGVKRAGFHVLRNTLIPAVLVEVGFLSHAQEEAALKQSDYRQKIADGIAAGLTSFASR